MKDISYFQSVLFSGTPQEKVAALKTVSPAEVIDIFDEVSALTNHHKYEVRAEAMRALRFVNPSLLTNIIREGLRDEHRAVRQAASELFHLHDMAA